MTIDINGDVIDEITIDGEFTKEVTIDGDIVFQGSAIPDSLLYHYTFDGGSLTDELGAGPTFTNNGASVTTISKSDDAYDFFGNKNSRLETTEDFSEIQNTSQVSVSMWVNPDTTSQPQDFAFLLSMAESYGVRPPDNELLMFSFDDRTTETRFHAGATRAITNDSLPANTYTMVTGTFNSGNLTLYYNETEKATAVGNSTAASGNNLMFIGDSAFSNNDDTFDGKIDEIKFYSKELTQSEVSNLFNTGSI